MESEYDTRGSFCQMFPRHLRNVRNWGGHFANSPKICKISPQNDIHFRTPPFDGPFSGRSVVSNPAVSTPIAVVESSLHLKTLARIFSQNRSGFNQTRHHSVDHTILQISKEFSFQKRLPLVLYGTLHRVPCFRLFAPRSLLASRRKKLIDSLFRPKSVNP